MLRESGPAGIEPATCTHAYDFMHFMSVTLLIRDVCKHNIVIKPFEFKPGPHQQQCRSNVRICCQKRQQCRTSFALKFRPFDIVERCLDNVASTLLIVWTGLYKQFLMSMNKAMLVAVRGVQICLHTVRWCRHKYSVACRIQQRGCQNGIRP